LEVAANRSLVHLKDGGKLFYPDQNIEDIASLLVEGAQLV
jgi:hypothetical protein